MSSPSKKKEWTSDFENLVRNGIEFLDKAISQLEKDPKHSVINFYTAVEIFLKAPLVHEHWTLVVVDRDLNRQSYEAGEFQSVSFDDACNRLHLTLKKQLPEGAKVAFKKIREHRNRMVHFYHSGIDGKQRDEIKLEQAQAWFELNRFVTIIWREKFLPFIPEFRNMERSLIANNHYAQAKYENLRSKIEGMKKGGKVFQNCPRCQTDAFQVESEVEGLTSLDCMVCLLNGKQVQVDCPECGDTDQFVIAEEGFKCKGCDFEISDEIGLFNLLDQNTDRGRKDDLDSVTPANCDECQSHQTVCDYEGGYLCTNCLAFFDTVCQCDSCNEYMTGDTDDTYVLGCVHCEGYAARHADD